MGFGYFSSSFRLGRVEEHFIPWREKYHLNLATGKFGVCAACRICEAPELQTYKYTSRLR
jgi:hypothetical protein